MTVALSQISSGALGSACGCIVLRLWERASLPFIEEHAHRMNEQPFELFRRNPICIHHLSDQLVPQNVRQLCISRCDIGALPPFSGWITRCRKPRDVERGTKPRRSVKICCGAPAVSRATSIAGLKPSGKRRPERASDSADWTTGDKRMPWAGMAVGSIGRKRRNIS